MHSLIFLIKFFLLRHFRLSIIWFQLPFSNYSLFLLVNFLCTVSAFVCTSNFFFFNILMQEMKQQCDEKRYRINF